MAQSKAVSGVRLATRLERVTERLAADAFNMERTGAGLIAHYMDPVWDEEFRATKGELTARKT